MRGDRALTPPRIAVWVDAFPVATETFVSGEARALRDLGWEVRVEARRRGAAAAEPGIGLTAMAEETTRQRLRDLAWLLARRPSACLGDVCGRRPWAREEHVLPLRALAPAARRAAARPGEHLHAHFAAGPALDALRVAALLGRRASVQVHGYDLHRSPANLVEKLTRAAFVGAPSAETAAHLRALAPRARVEEIVMGIDPDVFVRATPHPAAPRVLGVGRLVPKKGWDVLVRATARLDDAVFILVGEGPEHLRLEALCSELGVEDRVTLLGARSPGEIRAELECAAVLAAPSVVAADGDRDTMPVVVKEALAMEVPVVASDVGGLPEAVGPGWGRLVAPGDPEALAAALAELLALPASERAVMGRRGRVWVGEHAHVRREAEKLAALVGEA